MARYRTHNWFNLAIVLPLCIVVIYSYFPKEIAVTFTISFIIGTLLINPDCDIAHKTYIFSLRGLLLYPFRYYSRIFSHRGISHKHVIGTLTRIVWLAIFFFPIAVIIFFTYPKFLAHAYLFLSNHPKEVLAAFLALVIADSAHIFLDRV